MSGRPSDYNEEIAERICDQLATGRSLIGICDDKGMPDRTTVNRWMRKTPEFAANIARAREEQADYYLDRQIEIANSATVEDYLLRKFQADNLKWVASKMAPKKYGDKTVLSNDPENPVNASPVQVSLTPDLVKSMIEQVRDEF